MSCVSASVATFALWVMAFGHSARAAPWALVRILAEKGRVSLRHLVIGWNRRDFRAHLVALDGTLPVEAGHVRQTFTAAAAAPHGGHVVVKERAVVCGGVTPENTVGVIRPESSPHVTTDRCVSDLCCCCSGRPAHWWVRSRHGSRYRRSAHWCCGTACILVEQRGALWGGVANHNFTR